MGYGNNSNLKKWVDWERKRKVLKGRPETLKEYVDRGGVITVCPPAGSKELRGRPVPLRY